MIPKKKGFHSSNLNRNKNFKPRDVGQDLEEIDIKEFAKRVGEGTPQMLLSRFKAVLEAHKEKDIHGLESGLEELATAALGWKKQIERARRTTY